MATFAPAPASENRGPTGDERGPGARPRETVGDLLRRSRVEQGGELATIAAILRIRAPYLAAIEQARYDRLPGQVYALGFVRTYALHLGLDGDEAVRRFKLESAGLEPRRDLSFPLPLNSRSIPGGRMLLAAFVLAVCGYGIWHYLSTGERDRPERVAALPSDLLPPPAPAAVPADNPALPSPANAAPSSPPAAAAADDTAAAAPAPQAVTITPLPPPAAVAAPAPSLAAPPPPPLPPAIAAGAAPAGAAPPAAAAAPLVTAVNAPPPAAADGATPLPVAAPAASGPRVYGALNGPSRVTLTALKDAWIQVRDSDAAETVVAQRTLHPGDTYRVPDRGGLLLRTGNGSGLAITVDGRTAPSLGGTIHRNVPLDPERLLAGTAVEQ